MGDFAVPLLLSFPRASPPARLYSRERPARTGDSAGSSPKRGFRVVSGLEPGGWGFFSALEPDGEAFFDRHESGHRIHALVTFPFGQSHKVGFCAFFLHFFDSCREELVSLPYAQSATDCDKA